MNTFQLQILALRTFLFVQNLLQAFWSYGNLFLNSLLFPSPVYQDEYIFFEGYSTAIPISNPKFAGGPGLAKFQWIYNCKTKLLTYWGTEEESRTHHIPWLSATIHCNPELFFTLDEFINTLKYKTSGPLPSPNVLVAAWSLENETYFHPSENLEITVIDENGEEKKFSIWSKDPIDAEENTYEMRPETT